MKQAILIFAALILTVLSVPAALCAAGTVRPNIVFVPADDVCRAEYQGFDVNSGGCVKGAPSFFSSPYDFPSLADGPKGEYLTDRSTKVPMPNPKSQSE